MMKRTTFGYNIILLFLATLAIGCNNPKTSITEKIPPQDSWKAAQTYYLSNIDSALQKIEDLDKIGAQHPNSKTLFTELRTYFKKAEPYASYLSPEVGHKVNGPALPVFLEDNSRVMPPVGLQKIEEGIYDGETTVANFKQEIKVTKGLMHVLRKNIEKREVTPQRFFIATHQQLLRIIAFSITGFDTPVSNLGLQEAATSLQSLQTVYHTTLQNTVNKKNKTLSNSFEENLIKAINYLNQHTDFNTFDRFTFIRDYMNPITSNWVEIRKTSGLWEGTQDKPFNFDAPTFFETNSFNVNHFLHTNNRFPSPEQIALGEKLFFDKNLSGNGTMSCVTCHLPNLAYTDGKALGLDNKGKLLERNTPTLINSVYQKSFFWDGRSRTLEDQIASVFTNKKEFNSKVHQFSTEILKDSTYIKLFKKAYGQIPERNTDVVKAISAYIGTLTAFNSKFDRNIRAEEDTYTEQEKLGFNLFAGKALCATCHFIPLTNGTVPPFYEESEREVIGVPKTAANKQLDEDTGYYWLTLNEVPIHKGMFKTPTVRNAEVTGPYMHNGAYQTLEQVIDFYNKGGGAGLGFDVPHQTLPFDNLDLTDEEQQALVAFMKTLTDTTIVKKEDY